MATSEAGLTAARRVLRRRSGRRPRARGAGPAGRAAGGGPHPELDPRRPETETPPPPPPRAPPPPADALTARLKRVPPAPDGLQLADVAPRQESPQGLHVRPEAVVHAHHHPLAVFLARLQHPLDARDGEGERALAQHVYARRERRDDVDLVQVVGRTDRHRIGAGVFQHLFDVVERLLDLEPGGERLRFAQVVVADGRHFHAGQPPQRRQMGDLRDGSGPDHGDADRVAHFAAQWYITPDRRDAVDNPLERTPRASSVKRHRFAPNSAPMVPFSPAVISFRASCTNVPLIAAPLPWRKWAPRPIPM